MTAPATTSWTLVGPNSEKYYLVGPHSQRKVLEIVLGVFVGSALHGHHFSIQEVDHEKHFRVNQNGHFESDLLFSILWSSCRSVGWAGWWAL